MPNIVLIFKNKYFFRQKANTNSTFNPGLNLMEQKALRSGPNMFFLFKYGDVPGIKSAGKKLSTNLIQGTKYGVFR